MGDKAKRSQAKGAPQTRTRVCADVGFSLPQPAPLRGRDDQALDRGAPLGEGSIRFGLDGADERTLASAFPAPCGWRR